MTSLLLLLVLVGVGCESENKRDNAVSVDLRYGLVTSYSPYISFLQTPTAPLPSGGGGGGGHACSSQAVVRVSLRGPYQGVRLELEYGESPRLWTLDVADSPLGDGYGGNHSMAATAETHIHNRQLRVYGNGLPGYLDASLNGGHLLHVMEDVVKKGSRLWLDISDRRLEIGGARGATLQDMESPYLFSLGHGQRSPGGGGRSAGDSSSDVYIGLNRVVAGTGGRVGNGLCKVDITLYQFGLHNSTSHISPSTLAEILSAGVPIGRRS